MAPTEHPKRPQSVEQSPLPFAVSPYPNRRPAPHSVQELELRARALAGHTLGDLATALGMPLPAHSGRHKGFIGQLLEHALGADPTAGDNPDFPALGIELKTIPIGPKGLPAESTFCCAVTMANADHAQWEDSRLRRRLQQVLWMPIESAKTAPVTARRILTPRLWTPLPQTWVELRHDWEDLIGAIGSGAAITGHVGHRLQVRPKAARGDERTAAPHTDGAASVLPLGFYLRASFTADILAGCA